MLICIYKASKNADLDKYKYSGCGIGFYSRSEFQFTDLSVGKNAIIFRADMSSFVYIDNKNRDILILGEGSTQGLYDTILTAVAKYPINFTQPRKRFVLTSIIMEATVSYLLMLQKYIKSKQKTLK